MPSFRIRVLTEPVEEHGDEDVARHVGHGPGSGEKPVDGEQDGHDLDRQANGREHQGQGDQPRIGNSRDADPRDQARAAAVKRSNCWPIRQRSWMP